MSKIPTRPKLDRKVEDAKLTRLREIEPDSQEAASIREDVILANMLEAVKYLRGVSKGSTDDDGLLVSVAYRAMARAVKGFKPGTLRFFAYSKQYLRGEMSNELRFENFDYRRADPIGAHAASAFQPLDNDRTEDEMETIRMGLLDQFDFESIFTSERAKPIWAVINSRLSERERVIMRLKYEAGRNFQQIADLLRISRAATQATHRRALEKLRLLFSRKPGLLEDDDK